jgi:hypothetical protein
MLKTYRLRNIIMYGGMNSGELNTLLETEDEYFNALFDLRDNPRWVHNIAQNPSALAFFRWCPAATGAITEMPDIVDALVADDNYMNLIITSPEAIIGIASSKYMREKIESTPSARAIYATVSSAVMAEALVTIAALSGSYPDMDSIINDPTAMAAVAASSAAMAVVAASSTAMEAVFASVMAKSTIWESAAAIGALKASTTAVDYLKTIATQVTTSSTTTTGYRIYAGKILAIEAWINSETDTVYITNKAGASGSGNFSTPVSTTRVLVMTTHNGAYLYSSIAYAKYVTYIKMDA